MNLNDWFAKGMTPQQYIDGMTVNREELERIYDAFTLEEEDRTFFTTLRNKRWRVVGLTADWCGDAMLCVPILMRIAEVASIGIRLLIRDDNLELMDQYLTNGKSRSIPIFIFIDEDGKEQAVWGPRAAEVQQLVDGMRAELPDKDDPEFAERQQQMFKNFKERLLNDTSLWQATSRSMRERLEH